MLPSRTKRITREQIAAAVSGNPRLIKLFELLLSDVADELPAELATHSADIAALQASDVSITARVVVLEGELDGHAIEDEGTAVAQRGVMNFTGAGVAVTDLGGKTVVTIPGGSGGGSLDDILALQALL